MQTDFRKRVAWLIAIAAIIRMFVAAFVELGNDEVYYWMYSQSLQWNYFDHPPMIALWIRIFTGNLLLQGSELFVRLGSIVSCAVATWLLYKTCEKLHSPKAGWFAACLYNASLYAGIIAGTFAMPDSPQMVFWCSCLYLIVLLNVQPKSWLYWVLFGLCAGLCIMSKVHGVFIWCGMLFYIFFQKRQYFRLPQLYIALLLTAIIASPIVIWNINNGFVTYNYHSSRVAVHAFALNSSGFLREVFGEFFYNNPFIVVLSIMATRAWFRSKILHKQALSIYFWISLPMIGTLLVVALFKDTLPHWSGPAYVSLLPVTAIYTASRMPCSAFPGITRWALGFILLILVAGLSIINYYPGTLGKKAERELGKNDVTLDMQGWRGAGKSFSAIYQADVKEGRTPIKTPVVCYKWFPAAHEEYYFCRPLGLRMIGLGDRFDLHEYSLQYNQRIKGTDLNTAYCIVPSNEYYDAKSTYANYYATIDSVTTLYACRNNKSARNFYIYRLSGWKNSTAYGQ